MMGLESQKERERKRVGGRLTVKQVEKWPEMARVRLLR